MAAVIVVALNAAPVAVAKRGHFVMNASRTMEAHVRGSNGFGFSLFGSGGYVYLTASGHHATVQYVARGHASGRLIKARFGRVGSVSLMFHPRGGRHSIPEPPGNCKGEGEIVERGVFTGRLRFDGEMHYTSVQASRLRGKITRHLRSVCDETPDEGGKSPAVRWTQLQALSKDGRVVFDGIKLESSHSKFEVTSFIAWVFESHSPNFSIIRTVQVNASDAAFEVTRESGHVISATVEPPAPFSGTATYLRSPPSPSESWTGSLAAEFPGLGKVDLAGPEFCAESEMPRACASDSGVSISVGSGRASSG